MTAPRTALAKRGGVTGYLAESRDVTNSFILVAPLFLLYQVGILFTDGWRNGADLLTGPLVQLLGGNLWLYTLLNVMAGGALVGLYLRRRTTGSLRPRTAVFVVLESTAYASVLGGLVAGLLVRAGIQPAMIAAAGSAEPYGVIDAIVLSVGAGTWEELVFRAMLMPLIAAVLARRGRSPLLASVGAVVISSFIFSAFHYWPIGMDPWELWSFSFRFVLGVVFAGLYLWRGFAVAAYTHAIYDVFILVPRALLGG